MLCLPGASGRAGTSQEPDLTGRQVLIWMWAAVLFVLTVSLASYLLGKPQVTAPVLSNQIGLSLPVSYHFGWWSLSPIANPPYSGWSWSDSCSSAIHSWSGKSCNALEVALHCGFWRCSCCCSCFCFSFGWDLEWLLSTFITRRPEKRNDLCELWGETARVSL